MRAVLGRVPKRALIVPHVRAIGRCAGHQDVVRHHDGAWIQPPPSEDQFEVGQVGVLSKKTRSSDPGVKLYSRLKLRIDSPPSPSVPTKSSTSPGRVLATTYFSSAVSLPSPTCHSLSRCLLRSIIVKKDHRRNGTGLPTSSFTVIAAPIDAASHSTAKTRHPAAVAPEE